MLSWHGFRSSRVQLEYLRFCSVIANRFSRATLPRFLCLRALLGGDGLSIYEGHPNLIIAFEKLRSSLAAQVTVDAALVNVVRTGDILG